MISQSPKRPAQEFAVSACLFLICTLGFGAGRANAHILSTGEFKSLAEELAPRVNLFHDTWRLDPDAEFYGGTTRDYLYWIIRQFASAKTEADKQNVTARLRSMRRIDIQDFIYENSDVDIVTTQDLRLKAEDYVVRKIDKISKSIFDPNTPEGFNELNQGYIPAEKIRLTRHGLVNTPGFVDGLPEILSRQLTVHFSSDELFRKTHYAARGENHAVLLALRYLRLLAVDYYQYHGTAFPVDVQIPKETEAQLAAIFAEVRKPSTLRPYLKSRRFASWLNGSLDKAFRANANPSAAMSLFRKFGVDQLSADHAEIKSLFSYVFAVRHNDEEMAKNFAKFKTSPETLFTALEKKLPGGVVLHGTDNEENFRSILLQGIMPSQKGTAREGAYVATEKNIALPLKYANGSKERLVRLKLRPETRLIDLTRGEGARILKELGGVNSINQMVELFGADVFLYPYESPAFVIKNSEVIQEIQGYTRQIRPQSWLYSEAERSRTAEEFLNFLSVLQLQRKTTAEKNDVLNLVHLEEKETQKTLALLANSTESSFRTFAIAALSTLSERHPDSKSTPLVQAEVQRILEEVDRTIAPSWAWNFVELQLPGWNLGLYHLKDGFILEWLRSGVPKVFAANEPYASFWPLYQTEIAIPRARKMILAPLSEKDSIYFKLAFLNRSQNSEVRDLLFPPNSAEYELLLSQIQHFALKYAGSDRKLAFTLLSTLYGTTSDLVGKRPLSPKALLQKLVVLALEQPALPGLIFFKKLPFTPGELLALVDTRDTGNTFLIHAMEEQSQFFPAQYSTPEVKNAAQNLLQFTQDRLTCWLDSLHSGSDFNLMLDTYLAVEKNRLEHERNQRAGDEFPLGKQADRLRAKIQLSAFSPTERVKAQESFLRHLIDPSLIKKPKILSSLLRLEIVGESPVYLDSVIRFISESRKAAASQGELGTFPSAAYDITSTLLDHPNLLNYPEAKQWVRWIKSDRTNHPPASETKRIQKLEEKLRNFQGSDGMGTQLKRWCFRLLRRN